MEYIRGIDDMGRIVIPKDIRILLEIEKDDKYEISTEGDDIILRKYNQKCIFCGSEENVKDFNGKGICSDCALKISELQRCKSW